MVLLSGAIFSSVDDLSLTVLNSISLSQDIAKNYYFLLLRSLRTVCSNTWGLSLNQFLIYGMTFLLTTSQTNLFKGLYWGNLHKSCGNPSKIFLAPLCWYTPSKSFNRLGELDSPLKSKASSNIHYMWSNILEHKVLWSTNYDIVLIYTWEDY